MHLVAAAIPAALVVGLLTLGAIVGYRLWRGAMASDAPGADAPWRSANPNLAPPAMQAAIVSANAGGFLHLDSGDEHAAAAPARIMTIRTRESASSLGANQRMRLPDPGSRGA
jgi:hypothetical protein